MSDDVYLTMVPSNEKYPALDVDSGNDVDDKTIMEDINREQADAWRMLANA